MAPSNPSWESFASQASANPVSRLLVVSAEWIWPNAHSQEEIFNPRRISALAGLESAEIRSGATTGSMLECFSFPNLNL